VAGWPFHLILRGEVYKRIKQATTRAEKKKKELGVYINPRKTPLTGPSATDGPARLPGRHLWASTAGLRGLRRRTRGERHSAVSGTRQPYLSDFGKVLRQHTAFLKENSGRPEAKFDSGEQLVTDEPGVARLGTRKLLFHSSGRKAVVKTSKFYQASGSEPGRICPAFPGRTCRKL